MPSTPPNPLATQQRDALASSLKAIPHIREMLDVFREVGIDVTERTSKLDELELIASKLLDKFFNGYRQP